MRNVLFLLIVVGFCFNNALAQDVVRFKNGKEVQVKILEMTEDVVSYKKWSYLEGPTINAPMSKVVSITYANGETESFDEAAEAAAAPVAPTIRASAMPFMSANCRNSRLAGCSIRASAPAPTLWPPAHRTNPTAWWFTAVAAEHSRPPSALQ